MSKPVSLAEMMRGITEEAIAAEKVRQAAQDAETLERTVDTAMKRIRERALLGYWECRTPFGLLVDSEQAPVHVLRAAISRLRDAGFDVISASANAVDNAADRGLAGSRLELWALCNVTVSWRLPEDADTSNSQAEKESR